MSLVGWKLRLFTALFKITKVVKSTTAIQASINIKVHLELSLKRGLAFNSVLLLGYQWATFRI